MNIPTDLFNVPKHIYLLLRNTFKYSYNKKKNMIVGNFNMKGLKLNN